MKRFGRSLGLAALLVTALGFPGTAAGRFDQKLSVDKQIVHVLNRLTFGPRPGDVEKVRRLTVEKWIDLQLHPDRIPENPVLEAELKPLATLQLAMWQLLEKYPPVPPALMVKAPVLPLLPPQQMGRLMNCSAEERRTMLASLDPETRRLFLTAAPPHFLEGLPGDLQQEATKIRQEEQEARQKQIRKLMPPLNELLSPEQIRTANRGTTEEKIALLNSFDAGKRLQILRALPPQSLADVPEFRREAMAARQPQEAVNSELIENKLYRAIDSNRQLQEVLVDFWMNHFNVFNGKGPDRVLLTSFERDAIRPYVFGHFKDMLLATARHPAMLFYLDNWQSQVPRDDIPFPPGVRRPGLNENYGRELMELHTLGVDGGYTQQDVISVARAFTGWTILGPRQGGGFRFEPRIHDSKEKIVLGQKIKGGGGQSDGEKVLDIIARSPATAHFISFKLARRFVSDSPSTALVDHAAQVYLRTDGDIREVLRSIITSPEFFSQQAFRSKVKSPFEVVVSAARALNAAPDSTPRSAQLIAYLGQPIFGHQAPNGWPETGESWMNTGAILNRINFGMAAAAGRIPGADIRAIPALDTIRSAPRDRQVDVVVATILNGMVSPDTR